MRGLSKDTKQLIEYAYRVLEADHPQTLRQLHYAIFSRGEIEYENNQANYKRLSRATADARRKHRSRLLAGLSDPRPSEHCIPPEWMVDETRRPESANLFTDAAQYIELVKRAYHRDYWQTQQYHCEVWSEKATILGTLRPVADEWGVTLRVLHGFGSAGMEHQVGDCFDGINRKIVVFYLGDHDPSGRIIEEDMHRRVEAASCTRFTMRRLAIHQSDIARFNLPPQRIKTTDSRAASFQKRFGANASTVELDALPVAELRRRVEEAVSALIDFDLWNRQVRVEKVELDCIVRFAEQVRHLPQISA